MSSEPTLSNITGAQREGWNPLVLSGLPELKLSYHFSYTEDSKALILRVGLDQDPHGPILSYGMNYWELGPAWDDDTRAKRRLKTLAQAELRKDLFFFFERKELPRSLYQTVWIDSKGRSIS
jgi:hypothetical protein